MTLTRAVGVAAIFGLLTILAPYPSAAGEATFSLGVGQSVKAGQYTLVFTGTRSGRAAYDLYSGSTLVAQFPGQRPNPNPAEYSYLNGSIAIVTTGLAADGTQATGKLLVP